MFMRGERYSALQVAGGESLYRGRKGTRYSKHADVYMKLSVIDGVLIVSFKEL